jgi:predicted acylesterase/phospholipase RssA
MRLLGFLFTWMRRLPASFIVLFVACNLLYLLLVSQLVVAGGVQTITSLLWLLLALPNLPPVLGIDVTIRLFLDGITIVLLISLGVLLSYNAAAWAYRHLRTPPKVTVPLPLEPSPGRSKRLDRFESIGIILAGGGAKGAYQAGAMKAIYEFLEENNALSKVKMIAGTSIGSWNAMFWLAGLIKSDGGPSAHEAWWRSISLARTVEFDSYWPLRTNHFLLPTPWQETFKRIFAQPPEVRARLARIFSQPSQAATDPIHFYFTRSNVERGLLEFATNWTGISGLVRPRLRTMIPDDVEAVVPEDRYEVISGTNLDDALNRTERAVFASMDLPPLFPYASIKLDMTEWFEDGGVVDNLPLGFGAQVENCDLLFVLPLNASFAEEVNQTSVIKRLTRVVDVRQGVIERNAMKMTYLYNELAALRNKIEMLGPAGARPSRAGQERLETTALKRDHGLMSVFAICPAPPLGVGTVELWNARGAGAAFELMYAATKYELAENFDADTNPNWIRMTLVSPRGERTYIDDF